LAYRLAAHVGTSKASKPVLVYERAGSGAKLHTFITLGNALDTLVLSEQTLAKLSVGTLVEWPSVTSETVNRNPNIVSLATVGCHLECSGECSSRSFFLVAVKKLVGNRRKLR
jgi:hypothetical protein